MVLYNSIIVCCCWHGFEACIQKERRARRQYAALLGSLCGATIKRDMCAPSLIVYITVLRRFWHGENSAFAGKAVWRRDVALSERLMPQRTTIMTFIRLDSRRGNGGRKTLVHDGTATIRSTTVAHYGSIVGQVNVTTPNCDTCPLTQRHDI